MTFTVPIWLITIGGMLAILIFLLACFGFYMLWEMKDWKIW